MAVGAPDWRAEICGMRSCANAGVPSFIALGKLLGATRHHRRLRTMIEERE